MEKLLTTRNFKEKEQKGYFKNTECNCLGRERAFPFLTVLMRHSSEIQRSFPTQLDLRLKKHSAALLVQFDEQTLQQMPQSAP